MALSRSFYGCLACRIRLLRVINLSSLDRDSWHELGFERINRSLGNPQPRDESHTQTSDVSHGLRCPDRRNPDLFHASRASLRTEATAVPIIHGPGIDELLCHATLCPNHAHEHSSFLQNPTRASLDVCIENVLETVFLTRTCNTEGRLEHFGSGSTVSRVVSGRTVKTKTKTKPARS